MTQTPSRAAAGLDSAAAHDPSATLTTLGWAAKDSSGKLAPVQFERRALRSHDVRIAITHCGVCHSDLHQVRDEWHDTQPTTYPCLPGHEIVGEVVAVGEHVTAFHEGQLVGVGCMVDSCQNCDTCARGLEQYCENMPTMTYNAPDRVSEEITFGGYSQSIVVHEKFVLTIPDGMSPEVAAPILCAGVTVYSPMKHWKIGTGHKVGVVGIGGLGHMAIQVATALGGEVTAISQHASDKAAAAKELGAVDVLDSTDDDAMKRAEKRFDYLLVTIPFGYDPNPYLQLLTLDGTMINVGALEPLGDPAPNGFHLAMGRRSIAGSIIGGIEETQEVLEFCHARDIAPEIKMIRMDEINEAFERMNDAEVEFRQVIDMSTASAASTADSATKLDAPPK